MSVNFDRPQVCVDNFPCAEAPFYSCSLVSVNRPG